MDRLNVFGSFPQLSKIARPFRWSIPVVVCLSLVAAALEGAGIGLLIPLLATLTGSASGQAGGLVAFFERFAANSDPQNRLLTIAAAVIILISLKAAVQVCTRVFVAWIEGALGHAIRAALAGRVINASYLFHIREDSSRLVNVIATESWRSSDAVHAILNRFTSSAAICIFGAMLLALDWELTALVAIGAAVFRIVRWAFVKRLRRLSVRMSDENRILADRMLFIVHGARLIRLLRRQDAEARAYSQASQAVRRAVLRIAALSSALPSTFEVLHTLLFFVVMVAGIESGRSLAAVATFLVLLNRLQPYLRSLEDSIAAYASASGPLREVEWLLDRSTHVGSPAGSRQFRGLEEAIEFRNVGFSYGSAPVLENASFKIRANRATAIIGRSGAGKSTVLMLVCRLVDPTSGCIHVDGTPLDEIDPGSWLAAIGIAGQDIDLIDGTIAENIAYGGPPLDDDAIQNAARQAHAHDFIMDFENGYDTRVSARGTSLSGGQRQRIGIARALARKPAILILDEATNAVDVASEKLINDVLKEVSGRITTIVVSHRASSLELCDDGIVLSEGRVLDAGPLRELDAFAKLMEAE